MENDKRNSCRVCKGLSKPTGLLSRCTDKSCGAVHWDKSAIRRLKRENSDNQEIWKKVLKEANVPLPRKGKKSKYVYVLRLKGELNALYVGETGRHPYERYLNHLRGYKASRHAKNDATALLTFEGPMLYENAVKREKGKAQELRDLGNTVYQN